MKIVKLTGTGGNPILVNLAHAVRVIVYPDPERNNKPETRLWMVDGDYIPVRQTLPEIYALANG